MEEEEGHDSEPQMVAKSSMEQNGYPREEEGSSQIPGHNDMDCGLPHTESRRLMHVKSYTLQLKSYTEARLHRS